MGGTQKTSRSLIKGGWGDVNAQKLIDEMNEKSKQLTKENLRFFEDMMVYVRLASNKSELETEEILTEILDHLILAQEDGRTAGQVFGSNPKQFADDIIGELPKLVKKKTTLMFTMVILYFLSTYFIFTSIFNLVGFYFLKFGSPTKEFYLGSMVVELLLSIPIAFLCLYGVIAYFRWQCFRKISKTIEYLSYGLYGILSTGLFFIIIYFMPDFGTLVKIPEYYVLILGVFLFLAADRTKKAV